MFSVNLSPLNEAIINNNVSLKDTGIVHIVLHELLNQESPGQPIGFSTLINKHVYLDEDMLSNAINSIDNKYLNEELTDDFEYQVASSFICFSFEEHKREKELKQSLIDTKQANSKTLSQSIKDSNNGIRTVSAPGYIDRNKCNVNEFVNWIPTKTFLIDNRVFFIHEDLVKELQDNYPKKNIRNELAAIYKHLINNKSPAPATGYVLKYIRQWLSRDSQRSGSIENFLFGNIDTL